MMNKWSDPNCYEVFKITDAQVQIRYEVVRSGGRAGRRTGSDGIARSTATNVTGGGVDDAIGRSGGTGDG